MSDYPNGAPVHAKARTNGCTCPIMDNHYGKGWGGDGAKYGWVVSGACALHNEALQQLEQCITDIDALSIKDTLPKLDETREKICT